jgi:hypothetical protein
MWIWGLLIVVATLAVVARFGLRRRRVHPTLRRGRGPSANPAMAPGVDGREYVYVNDDGSARELRPDEIDYLATPFSPMDGARPYVKFSYGQRTPDGRLRGFMERRKLPPDVPVAAAD